MARTPLQELIAVYEEAAEDLISELDKLAAATGAELTRKALIFNSISKILQQLRGETDAWANTRIEKYLEQASRKAGRDLGLPNPEPLGSTINRQAVESLTQALTTPLENIHNSVQREALKLYRSTSLVRTFPELDAQVRRQVAVGLSQAAPTKTISKEIRKLLQAQYEDGIVEVIGKNGRAYHFGIKEYAEMVAHAVRRQAMSAGTILRAQEMDHDLVRVSTNPSTHGDYCDAWVGKVFSLSGNHPIYPSVDSLPFGLPPFHPRCRHSIGIFVPDLYIGDSPNGLITREPFLLHGDESPNDIVRGYWKLKKSGKLKL